MSDLDVFYVHTCTVETYLGETSFGPKYAAPSSPVPCWIDAQQLVTTSADGQQTTQKNTVVCCDLSYAALFAPQSKVTSVHLGGDNIARVAKVYLLDSGTLGLGLDHVEATLI
jgi:hypothetical protein